MASHKGVNAKKAAVQPRPVKCKLYKQFGSGMSGDLVEESP